MKRKDFLQKLLFCFAAAIAPKILIPSAQCLPIPKDELERPFRKFTLRPRSEGKTSLSLTESEWAEIKLQHAIILSPPSGLAIDMKYIRKYLSKNR